MALISASHILLFQLFLTSFFSRLSSLISSLPGSLFLVFLFSLILFEVELVLCYSILLGFLSQYISYADCYIFHMQTILFLVWRSPSGYGFFEFRFIDCITGFIYSCDDMEEVIGLQVAWASSFFSVEISYC